MLQKTSIGGEGASSYGDLSTVIAAMPATGRQHKIAVGALIVLFIVVAATIPLVHIQFPPINSFVPIVETAICITNLLTAAFLFSQYSVYPQRALLVLAGGFVFNGLFAFVHILVFLGVYGSVSLIGDGTSSLNWLFNFWITLFPATVIVYALSKDAGAAVNRSLRSIRVDIGVTIACVVAATAALTWVAISGAEYLPLLHQSGHRTFLGMQVSAVRALLNVTAFVVLFVRRRTILDQWMLVTLPAWMPILVEAIWLSHLRYTACWYLGRVYALLAGSALLFVLLTETLLLYRRSDQSQKLLIAELDHRVKNILAQVAVVASSTRQGSRSIDEFLGSLDARLQSMAATHTLLSENHWRSVRLDALVRSQLAPYATGANIRISGTKVMLTAAETQAVTRVLHELATNAAKYGALSTRGGQVLVSWDRKSNGAATNLTLVWQELGGPPVASAHPSSYGTNLICNLIPHELGGTVDLVFAKQGVNCRIEFPVRPA
jgi:two-component sensor histidine kinase